MLDALIFPLIAAIGGALPAGTGSPVLVDPSVGPGAELAWHDAGRPRTARRLGFDPLTGRTRLEIRELDSGLRYPAEVGPRALLTLPAARDPARDAARLGVRVIRSYLTHTTQPLVLVESLVAAEDGLDLAVRLGRTHTIMPDLFVAHRTDAYDDPLLMSQWYVRKLGLEAAWALSVGDPAVTIMVNDNGCELTHPDLVEKLDQGEDVLDDDGDPSYFPDDDGNEHGTACAGLIGATAGNGQGIVGACPECRVRCVRLLAPPPGLVSISDDVEAFQFGLDAGAAISSNSWGFVDAQTAPTPLARAITAFIEGARGGLGGFVVFAAGNDNRELVAGEIASIPGVITVGAVNNFDEPTSFTNFGAAVDLAAPTGSFTTDITGAEGHGAGDYFSAFGGTSSACPLVAGVLGLLVSAGPDKTAEEIQEVLRRSLKPAPFAVPDENGHDPKYGYGLVDPVAALRQLIPAAPDAGVVDSGAAVDGGVASPSDAASAGADAGVVAEADAGAPVIEDAGCGCRAAGTPGDAAWVMVVLGAALVRRRRRAREDLQRKLPPQLQRTR